MKDIFRGAGGGYFLSCFQEERAQHTLFALGVLRGLLYFGYFLKCLYVCICMCESLNYVWLSATPWTPGFSVHGILQPRILEGIAISSSRGSSRSRDQTPVSCIAGRFFTIWATWDAPKCLKLKTIIWFPLHLSPLPGVCFWWEKGHLLLPWWAGQAEEDKMGAGRCLFFSHVLGRWVCSCWMVSNLSMNSLARYQPKRGRKKVRRTWRRLLIDAGVSWAMVLWEAHTHPQSLDHHVDGGFGVLVILKVRCYHQATLGHCVQLTRARPSWRQEMGPTGDGIVPERGTQQRVIELKHFWESDSEVAEVERDQLEICQLVCWVGCYYLDEEKELLKRRCLYKGSGRMGGCGSVYVPRNAENLQRLRLSFSQK